jgi:hypothetical protein
MNWKNINTVLSLLLCAIPVFADVHPSDKIDQAVVYIEAGRGDVAEGLLRKLLNEDLSPDERATVLFDIATLRVFDGQRAAALELYDQIDTSNETLISSVNYNRALCLLEMAKEKQDRELAIRAKVSLNQVKESALVSKSMLTGAYEAFFSVLDMIQKTEMLAAVEKQNKNDLLQDFFEYQQTQFLMLLELLGQDDTLLYVANYKDQNQFLLQAYIDRIILYLQAPAKQDSVLFQEFFTTQFLSLKDTFVNAQGVELILHTLYQMMQNSYLVLQNTLQEDIAGALDVRMNVFLQQHYATKLTRAFWDNQVKSTFSFTMSYLDQKLQSIDDPIKAALLRALISHLEKSKDPLADYRYWQLISNPISRIFSQLFEENDPLLLQAALDRLSAYQEVHKNVQRSLDILSRADLSGNYRKAVFESWFLLYPNLALSFYADWIQKQLELKRDVNEDIELFTNLLSRFIPKAVPLDVLTEALRKKDIPIYFWLKWFLSSSQAEVSNIISKIDAAIYYQYMTPGRNSWQQLLKTVAIKQIDQLVEKSAIVQPLKSKLRKLFLRGIDLANQRGDISVPLLEAKRLLQKEELEKASSKTTNQASASPKMAPEKSDLSLQLQKKTLHLSGETSIRLLQEMEREDAKLFEKQTQKSVGPKPW